MSKKILLAFGISLALAVGVVAQRGGGAGPVRFPTPVQFTASAEAQRIVADAKKYAGTDLQWHYTNVCSSMGPQRVALALQAAGQTLKDYTVEPTKLFDNMWYVGLASQGAFVIQTSEGLILIDTLNTTEEARDIIVPSMKKVGLDPAQIKYIVLSHGHPGQTDHTGGANWFQATYKPRILMAKEDWDATLPAQRPERPLAKRDMDITHGQTLTLGDITLTFTTLFGHSDGSLGIFIPVKWRGQSSVVWLHGGGLHHPTRASLARLEEAVNKYARPMGAEALLNTHPGLYQDTIADMAAIRQNPTGPNPILLGRERANRYWSMVLDCARARVIALEDAAKSRS